MLVWAAWVIGCLTFRWWLSYHHIMCIAMQDDAAIFAKPSRGLRQNRNCGTRAGAEALVKIYEPWQFRTNMKSPVPLVVVSPGSFLCGEVLCINSFTENSSFFLFFSALFLLCIVIFYQLPRRGQFKIFLFIRSCFK